MIDCEHKWHMQVTNRGLDIFYCTKHLKSVNDTICSNCPDRAGHMRKLPMAAIQFPKRTEKEIEATYSICQSCPLLTFMTQQCKKMPGETHPVDIVAQNPHNHCPEGKW